jgi:lysine biosynthesis protein LysW
MARVKTYEAVCPNPTCNALLEVEATELQDLIDCPECAADLEGVVTGEVLTLKFATQPDYNEDDATDTEDDDDEDDEEEDPA